MNMKLVEVCDITMGQAPPGSSYNEMREGMPLIAGAGDFKDGSIHPKKFATTGTRRAEKGDIVLSIRASIGASAQADQDYILGRGVAGLRPGPKLDREYLRYWLDYMSPRLAAKGRGATFLQVNRTDIAELPITLPSMEDQQRLVQILHRVDIIREKRQEILEYLDSLEQAIFRDMFDGVFAETKVEGIIDKEKGSIRTGPFGSQLLHSEFVDTGIAVLGLDNVTTNEFRWGERRYITEEKYGQLRRYTVYPGDVLISIMGTTGRCAIVPNDIPAAINTKHICAITLDQELALPSFVRAAFLWHRESRKHLLRQTKGSVMDGLNMGIIKSMPLPLPTIELQKKYEAATTSLQETRKTVRLAAQRDDELFTMLLARAFRGEL